MSTKTTGKAKKPQAVLQILLGKKVVIQGKFAYGERERLVQLSEVQQGLVSEDLDASVNYLVLPTVADGKTIQKKAASLNGRGATIQVIDKGDFEKLVEPTQEQIMQLIRGGTANAPLLSKVRSGMTRFSVRAASHNSALTLLGETFDGLDLSNFNFHGIEFRNCSFIGCVLNGTNFAAVIDCDLSRATGSKPAFDAISRSCFREAKLVGPEFESQLDGGDFSAAELNAAKFSEPWTPPHSHRPAAASPIMARAVLRSAQFLGIVAKSPDFDGADLTGASFMSCQFDRGSFRGAILNGATLIDCTLTKANFNSANLVDANFGGSDISNSTVDGADVQDINLLGVTIGGVDFSKAKNYKSNALNVGKVGPALTELDTLCGSARRIAVTFQVRLGTDGESHEVGIDSRRLRWGGGVVLPVALRSRGWRHANATLSLAMMHLAAILGKYKVRYETIEVESTKSPKGGKELRDLAMTAICEAFNQPIPPADELATATKTFRDEAREQNAADRERREAAKKIVEKQQVAAKKQIARKIAKEVGQVTDIATFLKALELRADKSKIDKATKMLKAERFQLFNDITETHLHGVVKSQTDADLVYACRIESDGHYACCTQNLNICGGLRGSICKHLLVLIIGLVKAGQLDPADIDAWVAKSHDTKPELNKETMGEIFIRYKGAEAGEVDWRPTETVPEDYYAV